MLPMLLVQAYLLSDSQILIILTFFSFVPYMIIALDALFHVLFENNLQWTELLLLLFVHEMLKFRERWYFAHGYNILEDMGPDQQNFQFSLIVSKNFESLSTNK